jgi:tetratricopeptide (TPR) repeat protein
MDKTVTRSLLIPLALGGTLASLTLCFEKLSAISESPIIGDAQRFLVTLLFPGMLGSMVMGGNVHAWNLWVAAGINGLIYFGLGWLFYLLVARFRRRAKPLAIVVAILLSGISAHGQKSESERFQDAQRLFDAGKLPEAEKGFAEIVREHPDNIAAQMHLGQTLFREEKFSAAIAPYEKVWSLEKSGTKLTLIQHRILSDQLAMAYGISGRSADAKALLQESARTDPEYPLNYYNLACVSADEDDKAGVLKNLALAFQHKDQVLPGEQMPDPASDSSFKKYAQDADFKELLKRLRLHS